MSPAERFGTADGDIRTAQIRPVSYAPGAASRTAEFTDIATFRRRAGTAEFVAPQRLGFEMIVRVGSGRASHEVDFVTHPLEPGDVLWVHTGQVQRWGDIGRFDGEVLLFPPEILDTVDIAALRRTGARRTNRWPGIAPAGSALADAFAYLQRWYDGIVRESPTHATVREAAIGHAAAALALQVAAHDIASDTASTTDGDGPGGRDEVFDWLTERIDADFTRTRTVADYADRIGYSERTLNRVSQRNSGLTVKQLIDARVVLEAKRMLVHDDATVADIGETLGFDDAANFSGYFRHRTGMSPGSFRRAQSGDDPERAAALSAANGAGSSAHRSGRSYGG
ncbi:helix-turn-helix domain-containing protein [Millisia brevis]|uniref:helix-turn-helix domain-containing protein n=1 Tax=Millisia brevis TaxID=264148 RepID=UPI00082FAC7A|nr:helix-turn-helix domain-containing protein [Millisia brevis]